MTTKQLNGYKQDLRQVLTLFKNDETTMLIVDHEVKAICKASGLRLPDLISQADWLSYMPN